MSNNLAQQLDGKYVCPACGKGMTSITEHQGETIQWDFEDGDYQKSITNEYSDGKNVGNAVVKLMMRMKYFLIEKTQIQGCLLHSCFLNIYKGNRP